MKTIVDFSVDVKGDDTGRQYQGFFQVRTKTSYRQILDEDRVRRTVLGANPEGAGPEAIAIAESVAYLAVRLVRDSAEAPLPNWWTQSDGGLELPDLNVLGAVKKTAIEAISKEWESKAEEAKKATGELREAIPPDIRDKV